MKKILSQQSQYPTLKPSHSIYTDTNSSASTEHSLDSSFQDKCSQQEQTLSSSTYSDSSMEDESEANEKVSKFAYYKRAVDWLTRKYRKFKLRMETLYLAISYLIKYMGLGVQLKYHAELLASVFLLVAAKINQVHFPSIKSLLGSLDLLTTKSHLLQIQEELIALFNFDLAMDQNAYSILYQHFASEPQQKRKNAQKLLHLSIANPQTLEFGETYLTLSIVYLLKPDALKQTQGINRDRMKKIAFIVYNMYKEKKNELANKENIAC